MNPSTRSLRSSRRSSPVTEPLAPTEPLTTHDLTNVCAVIRERLLLAPADKPAVSVQAFFRRKDEPNESIAVHGKVRQEGLELWAVWEDEPTKEYPFPHAELNYYQVKIHHFPGEVSDPGEARIHHFPASGHTGRCSSLSGGVKGVMGTKVENNKVQQGTQQGLFLRFLLFHIFIYFCPPRFSFLSFRFPGQKRYLYPL